jgi:hypothetical protein
VPDRSRDQLHLLVACAPQGRGWRGLCSGEWAVDSLPGEGRSAAAAASQGVGESAPVAYFYQNLGEAEYVVSCYQYMRLLGYPAHKISILTTYNGQKALLRDVIERRCAGHQLFGRPHKVWPPAAGAMPAKPACGSAASWPGNASALLAPAARFGLQSKGLPKGWMAECGSSTTAGHCRSWGRAPGLGRLQSKCSRSP